MKIQETHIWVVAYINVSQIGLLNRDLQKDNQINSITAYVPTVKVLKKQFKGKEIFDEVPLLLNYGFFRIPIAWAINIDMLNKVKEDISCIAHWVKDIAKHKTPTQIFNEEEHTLTERVLNHLDVPFATITEEEVLTIMKVAAEETVYSSDEIDRLKPGTIITLVTYPFEGMEAVVINVDKKRKKILVNLDIVMTQGREIEVSFDNVFYSIYKGSYDEDYGKEKLIEDTVKRKQ